MPELREVIFSLHSTVYTHETLIWRTAMRKPWTSYSRSGGRPENFSEGWNKSGMKNRLREVGLLSMEKAPGRPDYGLSILKGGLQE